jgi:hypothetical protein
MKITGRLLIFTLILIVVQTACKLMFAPRLEWSGFSPLIAIALVSGFIIKEKTLSFLLPLIALFMSDVIIHLLYLNKQFDFPGLYAGQWKNYVILLSCTAIGWIFRGRTLTTLGISAVTAPTIFFLASNFMVWRATSEAVYARSFSGLMDCYEAALPFYRNSLFATIIFLPLILLVYNYLIRRKLTVVLA